MAIGKYAEWLEEDNLIRIEGWARDGLTEEQIAHNMGVSLSTLKNWKKDHLPILTALKKGKDVTDRIVENALYKKATGYTVTVKKPIKIRTEKQKDGAKIVTEEIQYVEEEVYYPPDTTAQIFWLKNRKPIDWRDKQIEAVTLEVEDLSSLADMLKDDD